MDGPRGQPQHLAGERGEHFEACRIGRHGGFLHRDCDAMLPRRLSLKISNFGDMPEKIRIFYQPRAVQTEFVPMPTLDAIDRKILCFRPTAAPPWPNSPGRSACRSRRAIAG